MTPTIGQHTHRPGSNEPGTHRPGSNEPGSNGLGPNTLSRNTMSLHEVQDAIAADDLGKWDTLVRRDDLALHNGQLTGFAPADASDASASLTPTSWATGQLCARLGIPVTYYRKCPVELQDIQVNHWLKHATRRSNDSDSLGVDGFADGGSNGHTSNGSRSNGSQPQETWQLRAKGDTLRAILSERYTPLDNRTLLQELEPLLSSRYRVDWFGLSEESLHLRIVDPHKCREVLPDDPLTVGIHLSNSEVGFRALTVDALVYRLVCTNGLIRLVKGKSLLRQRHIHIAQPRFVAALAEAVEGALLAADGFLDELQRTTRTPVPQVETTLERLGEAWGLSDEAQQAAKAVLKREVSAQQDTLYGVINAFTSVAQSLPDEARYDLEVLAGNLAAHGVPAFALAPQEMVPKERAMNGNAYGSQEGRSVVQLAQEMFEAEVVGSQEVRS